MTSQLKVKEVKRSKKSLRKYISLVKRDGITIVLTPLAEKMETERRTIIFRTMNTERKKAFTTKEEKVEEALNEIR